LEFKDVMTPPAFISGPDPEYTEKAVEREVQGTMLVKCVVTLDGTVHGCRVLKGLPFMDRATVDALERRRYAPAMYQGKPVAVDYTFQIKLALPHQQ
jgi:protein TonB